MFKKNPYWKYVKNETREHYNFAHFIRLDARTKNLLWFHAPNEAKRTKFEQFLVKIMGVKKGVSDFIFLEPRGKYHGLAIEMKNKGVRVYKKNNECYFPTQEKFLKMCRNRGYKAEFAVGSEEAEKILIDYLNEKNEKK